ncbi:pyridoxal 5'-phosphate synthase lyase subunit PdxS, partial [Staphylococcus epidermidis]
VIRPAITVASRSTDLMVVVIMTEAIPSGATPDVLSAINVNGCLPVVKFAAGGVATHQDAALMMELGADGVFVGSGIFKSEDPEKFANAIVQATTHYQDYEWIGRLAKELGTAMKGLDINELSLEERMQ